MATNAAAEPETRPALRRAVLRAAVAFLAPLVVLVAGLLLLTSASQRQQQLERDGQERLALVIRTETVVPGLSRVTFAYDGDGDRVRADLVTLSTYEQGQQVTAYVDADDPTRSTIEGETPRSTLGWFATGAALLVGIVGVPIGAQRAMRTSRLWSVARTHPWSDAVLQASYPARRRMAVSFVGSDDEHLVGLDRRSARRLAGLDRKAPLLIAGSGRWFALSPTAHRSVLALVRMDEPYERLHLVHPGAAPDRFDEPEPEPEPAPDP